MENSIITLRIKATSTGKKSDVTAAKHHFIVDEPEQLGGNDEGPNPLQYVLGALAGCENIMTTNIASEMNFQLNGIQFEIDGTVDRRGMAGDASVVPYFQKISIRAKVDTPEPESRLRELQETVDRRCPVYTMIKAAGVELHSEWVRA